jgi:DNA-binding CsgD family transcriptional regulator
LLERERELAVLQSVIERARVGAGGLVVIEGPAGIGKTRLVGAARAIAEDVGLAMFHARGSDLERDFAHGVVRQLFEQRVAREPDTLLAGVASHVRSVFGRFAEADVQPVERPSPIALDHALYWLVANLAERTPVMVAVDDAHWADEASLRFLLYLARRIDELPVALVLTVRPDPSISQPELIARIAAESSAAVVSLHPLSATAANELIRSVVGSDADDRLCEACYRSTGGNPLLLRELANALAETGSSSSQHDVSGIARLVPRAVARHVLIRLARLSPSATAVARAVAVLGAGTELVHAAPLAGLDEASAANAIDALVASDILAAERPLAFVHPLLREVIYLDLAPETRALEHRRAARLLADVGATAERTASQLLAGGPAGEDWVVPVLRAAAHDALARGSAASAVTYLRRALAEPPSRDETASILLDLGLAESGASLTAAVEHLTEALKLTPDPISRAHIAADLAVALEYSDRPAAAAALLRDTIEMLGDSDDELRMNLEAQAVVGANTFLDMRRAFRDWIVRFRERVAPLTSPRSGPLLAALAGELARRDGTAHQTAACAERSLASGLAAEGLWDGVQILVAAEALTRCDRLAQATSILDTLVSSAQARGATRIQASALTARAVASYRAGRLRDAEVDARLALELAEGDSSDFLRPYKLAQQTGALIERGQIEAAARLLRPSELNGDRADRSFFETILRDTYAQLLARQGRLKAALRELQTVEQADRDWDNQNPGWTIWRSTAAFVHHRLGNWEKAAELAAEDVRAARAFGAPLAIGTALRTAALVARGDRIEQLREAANVLERSEARLEYAHTLVELGAALRRSGHRSDAREPLTIGLELARECGASPLADNASHELAATGARVRGPRKNGPGTLTPSELRIAAMAAEGLTNREIAQALYLSPKTVEMHMSHAFDKLEISSRVRLAAALQGSQNSTGR